LCEKEERWNAVRGRGMRRIMFSASLQMLSLPEAFDEILDAS
jgi:hypothetical protein